MGSSSTRDDNKLVSLSYGVLGWVLLSVNVLTTLSMSDMQQVKSLSSNDPSPFKGWKYPNN